MSEAHEHHTNGTAEGPDALRVLISGGDHEVRQRISQVLRKRGHQIVAREGAEPAWSYYEPNRPALVILLDVTEESLSLCRRIRRSPGGDESVVLAVIYPYVEEKLQRALGTGVDECIMESLVQPHRLNARIAFAERQARVRRARRRAEQDLRASEAKARAIIETTVEGIIVIDEQGTIQDFNKAAEDIFGYTSDEVIGSNVRMLMPAPWHDEHDGYIRNYLETGAAKIIGHGREVLGERKDGSTFPMQLGVNEVDLGTHRLFTGIVRDVSEQRRLEKEILRISEQERRRIGEDLHEGLGQILSGVTLLIEDLHQTLLRDGSPHADRALKISRQLRDADRYTDDLVRGLVPVDVDEHGLVDALLRLTDNLAELFDITCKLNVKGDPSIENPTVAFHLYRITREAINNAVKHGRATKVTTTLSGGKHKIRIRVKDNGTGFPEKNLREKNGVGLQIMRYRARIIGARLNVHPNPSGGTIVTCTLNPTASTVDTNPV